MLVFKQLFAIFKVSCSNGLKSTFKGLFTFAIFHGENSSISLGPTNRMMLGETANLHKVNHYNKANWYIKQTTLTKRKAHVQLTSMLAHVQMTSLLR